MCVHRRRGRRPRWTLRGRGGQQQRVHWCGFRCRRFWLRCRDFEGISDGFGFFRKHSFFCPCCFYALQLGSPNFYMLVIWTVRHDLRLFLLPFNHVAIVGPALRAELMPSLHVAVVWPDELACSSIPTRDWVANSDSRVVMAVLKKLEMLVQRIVQAPE